MHIATDLDRTRISAKLAHVDEFFEFREAQAHRIGSAVDGDHDAVEIQLAESAIATDADLAADANVVRRGLIATDFITELEAVELLGLAGAALVFFRHETTEAINLPTEGVTAEMTATKRFWPSFSRAI